MDLTKAYEVDSLVKLERTFSYLRSAPGRVDITDHVAFTRPESFESALITYANWRVDADGSILISDRDVTVRATIQADGDDLLFEHGVIHESATPTRLAWRIREPVTTAMVRISVVPA